MKKINRKYMLKKVKNMNKIIQKTNLNKVKFNKK